MVGISILGAGTLSLYPHDLASFLETFSNYVLNA